MFQNSTTAYLNKWIAVPKLGVIMADSNVADIKNGYLEGTDQNLLLNCWPPTL